MNTQYLGEVKRFSHLSVLSLVSRRVISLDERDDEVRSLLTHLLGRPVVDTDLHGKPLEVARQRLFEAYPNLCPVNGKLTNHFGSLERHLVRGQIREQDIRNYLLVWASNVQKDLNLPFKFEMKC